MPRAPKACGNRFCKNKVRGKTYCPDCQPEAWDGGHGSTRKGRTLREQVLREEPSCRDCGGVSTEAGHIVPKAYGGEYTRANLKGQCRVCNLAQIASDRAALQERFSL